MVTKNVMEVKMELSETKIEQLNKMPVLETQESVSSDGRWYVHKTVITSIKPLSYVQKVMDSNGKAKKKK